MKNGLITAVLMTTAAIAWVVNAFFLRATEGIEPLRVGIAVVFTVLAIFYWVLYVRRRNTASGAE